MMTNETTIPPTLVDALRTRIADPGAFLPRILDTAINPGETVGNWAARAISAGLADGSLGVNICSALCRDVEVDRDRLAAEVEQLRYERTVLGACRRLLDNLAENAVSANLRRAAGDLAQRITDEIGHPVTDEPALGPQLRAELARVTAERDDLRAALRDLAPDQPSRVPDVPCPKCGDAEVWIRWCNGHNRQLADRCFLSDPEHFHRGCRRCHYTWQTEVSR